MADNLWSKVSRTGHLPFYTELSRRYRTAYKYFEGGCSGLFLKETLAFWSFYFWKVGKNGCSLPVRAEHK